MHTLKFKVVHVFPFTAVPPGAEIIIWGFGYAGKQYFMQVLQTGYCKIKYVVDRDRRSAFGFPVEYRPPEALKEEKNALVLISAQNQNVIREIQNELHFLGIPDDSIISCPICVPMPCTDTKFEIRTCLRSDVPSESPLFQIRRLLSVRRPEGVSYVRVGSPHDGGYLMLDTIERGAHQTSGTAYSFGIGDNADWDLDMARRGWKVYMYDHTIEHLPREHPNFRFFKTGIADSTCHSSDTEELRTLLAQNGHSDRDHMIMKMDVEGAEWGFLETCDSRDLSRFDQIILEIHGLLDVAESERKISALKKLNATHQVVHVHANNYGSILWMDDIPFPKTMEVTYALRDRFRFSDAEDLILPSELDQPCWAQCFDFPLGKWNVEL